MNIALVVHELHDHGGHSAYTKVLADGLSLRHEVTVFANRCERPGDARWNFCPVPAWRINALSTVGTFPIGMRSVASRLAEFDIRHMQGYCGGQPNVVTAHICVAAYLNSLRSINLRNLTSLRLMAAAEARFYQRYEGHVIAISQKIARELQEFYKLRGPITVIPHGVDTHRFNGENREDTRALVRSELGIDDESTLALYVGDLVKSHTHLKAIAAAAPEVEVVIVTASSQYHWHSRNVHILPHTSNLARFYAAADAFVFPTTYDAFGMVALEAMASGLPVFSSDCAGASDLIHHGRDGFVIPLDDWVEATIARLRDHDLLERVGHDARKTAQRHNWQTVVGEVERVYVEASARSAGSEIQLKERLTTRGAFEGSLN
jgi:UDP-glucose:(heptosyl)LPS alpha-1,3-glucosyltransferase